MKKNKYNILQFTIIIIALIYLSSCNECPIKDTPPIFICNVKQMTVTQFNPQFTKLDTNINGRDTSFYVPVPQYSIHSFLFPNSGGGSGSLPDESSYKISEFSPVGDKIVFKANGFDYYAAILDQYPSNYQLSGDLLVDEVYIDPGGNPDNNFAYIRFWGDLALISPPTFKSENSRAFCSLVTGQIMQTIGNYNQTKYGQGITSRLQKVAYNTTTSRISALDKQNREVQGITIPDDIKQKLVEAANKLVYRIKVYFGDIFLYTAKNGRQFIITISDINRANPDPRKTRITVMFNPLSGE